MQRRLIISHRPYWITTHDLDGEWYAIGTFAAEAITVAAGNEAEAVILWREAALSHPGGGETSAKSNRVRGRPGTG
jgi:hypothetical protein